MPGHRDTAAARVATAAPLTGRALRVFDLSETHLRELETTLGLPRDRMGRDTCRLARDGLHPGADLNPGAAIGYARGAGLRHQRSWEVTYHPNRSTAVPHPTGLDPRSTSPPW